MIPAAVRTALIVATKELSDLRRDPRTLLISLGLPLLLFPLLFWTLGEQAKEPRDSGRTFVIGTANLTPAVATALAADTQLLLVPALPGERPPEEILAERQLDVLIMQPGSETEERSIQLYYNNADRSSAAAFDSVTRQLAGMGRVSAGPAIESHPLYPPGTAAGRVILGLVLPFMLLIFGAACPLPIAADLSSGEKERLSLEPLLSTAAPRGAIALGKLLAAGAAGFVSLCAFFAGVYLAYRIQPEIAGPGPVSFSLNPLQITLFLLTSLMTTFLFAALELTAGFFTRSAREAQLLGMPLLLIAGGAVYLAQIVDLQAVPAIYPHLPLVNLALAAREAAENSPDPVHIVTAFAWGGVYLALSVYGARRLLNREATILAT